MRERTVRRFMSVVICGSGFQAKGLGGVRGLELQTSVENTDRDHTLFSFRS